MRFGLYEHTIIFKGKLITRYFVVLKENKDIVAWTDFHRYIKSQNGIKRIESTNKQRYLFVIKFLNYIFIDNTLLTNITELNVDVIKQFLNDYGLKRLKGDDDFTHRGSSTVTNGVKYLIDFVDTLNQIGVIEISTNDFYKNTSKFSAKRRKMINTKVPVFDVYYEEETKKIFRDITEPAIRIIMHQIIIKHKSILMLSALCLFAGLRPSEACNVRREDSLLGPGIMFDVVDGKVMDARIDLSKELNLRSDFKSVGKIKRERIQQVCPIFLNDFCECYEIYMKFIYGRKYEKEYGALSIDRNGRAMTYNAFLKEFKKVIEEVIPIFLASDDPKLVLYGQKLQQNSISPHILRHYFSAKLTILGASAAELMSYRGDKSPESVLTYIQNKSELVNQLEMVSGKVFEFNLWKTEKI